jgi:formaldehyde dismutase / methanol dehydrogenase
VIEKKISEFPLVYTRGAIAKIAIGWGAHETVADECKSANIKKALIVTTGLKGTGIVDEIKQILNYHGISTEIFNKVTSNPKDYEAMAGYTVFKEAQCDGVVSIGGGSSHDCGKMIRAVATHNGKHICDMVAFLTPPWSEEVKKYKTITIPQVTVNTTAGTGAESSFGATVVNTKTKSKQLIILNGIAPTTALIDPLLVRLVPQRIAAWSGFDALTHSVEPFVSRIRSRHTSAIALSAHKIISENIREFTYNRNNNIACENMCWGESMASFGFWFGGGAGIVHGLAHGISAVTDAHHGLANASVMIAAERYNETACPERFAEMAEALGVDTNGLTRMQAADRWFIEIERLMRDLNIVSGQLTKQFGLQKKDIEHIVSDYANDLNKEGNPRDFNFTESVEILESML